MNYSLYVLDTARYIESLNLITDLVLNPVGKYLYNLTVIFTVEER